MWFTSDNEEAEQTLTERTPIIAAADLEHVDMLQTAKNEMYDLKDEVLKRKCPPQSGCDVVMRAAVQLGQDGGSYQLAS